LAPWLLHDENALSEETQRGHRLHGSPTLMLLHEKCAMHGRMQCAAVGKHTLFPHDQPPFAACWNLAGVEVLTVRRRGMRKGVSVVPDNRVTDIHFDSSRRKLHGFNDDEMMAWLRGSAQAETSN
jgi:hypothetical protein